MKQLVDDIIKEKEKRKRQRFEIGSSCGDDSVEADDVEIDRGMSRGKRSVDESAPSRKGVQSYFAPRTNPGSQRALEVQWLLKKGLIMLVWLWQDGGMMKMYPSMLLIQFIINQ